MSYPPPQGPQPYGQPPRYQPPQRKKTSPVLIGCGIAGGLLALLLIIGAIGAALSVNKAAGPSPAEPPTVGAAPSHTTGTGQAGKPAGKTTAPAPAAKPVTVLTEKGNGIKSTASFSVHGDWDLTYAYNCSAAGGTGNFQVWINGSAGDVLVNELAGKGGDTTHQHDGPGKISLQINSECSWTIRVDQLPG